MFKVEKIKWEEIPFVFFQNYDTSKYNLWPVTVDLQALYTKKQTAAKHIDFTVFAVYNNNELLAILDFSYSDYDTRLFGFTCGKIEYLIVKNELPATEKSTVLNKLFDAFQKFRIEKQIRFCLISINNNDSVSSDTAQSNGFKYRVTWGDCIYNSPQKEGIEQPYSINKIKKESDLPFFMQMLKNYFKGGRFYIDPNFSNTKVDQLYQDLIYNSFHSKEKEFVGLYKDEMPIGCFICNEIQQPFDTKFKTRTLRFLVANTDELPKGMAKLYLTEVSHIFSSDCDLLISGIEMNNLASLKIHVDAGYKFNYIHSAYHSWL